MKKILGLFMVMALLVGCDSVDDFLNVSRPNIESESTNYVLKGTLNELEVITIEGCEYFYYNQPSNFGITHKGNCTNEIHKCK